MLIGIFDQYPHHRKEKSRNHHPACAQRVGCIVTKQIHKRKKSAEAACTSLKTVTMAALYHKPLPFIMHYFTLNTPDDQHIGFLIMQPDEDSNGQSGQLALKLLDNLPPHLRASTQILAHWQAQAALSWEISGERVEVWDDEGDVCGYIRQEILSIGGHRFILNDLTGNM